jgi:hypothetical protein
MFAFIKTQTNVVVMEVSRYSRLLVLAVWLSATQGLCSLAFFRLTPYFYVDAFTVTNPTTHYRSIQYSPAPIPKFHLPFVSNHDATTLSPSTALYVSSINQPAETRYRRRQPNRFAPPETSAVEEESEEYWFDHRIHSLGNTGFFGGLHAATAMIASKIIDIKAYGGTNMRLKVCMLCSGMIVFCKTFCVFNSQFRLA